MSTLLCYGVTAPDPGGPLFQSRERFWGQSGQIFVPEADFECESFVGNVLFPTGIVELERTVRVYYGAADTSTAVVELFAGPFGFGSAPEVAQKSLKPKNPVLDLGPFAVNFPRIMQATTS